MDDKTYRVALSPDLDISPEEFAKAWNENDEARILSEARLSETKGVHFLDPMLVTVLISVGTGVASSLLTDIIEGVVKQLWNKKGGQGSTGGTPHKHTHIEQMRKPDGTEILIVDIDE